MRALLEVDCRERVLCDLSCLCDELTDEYRSYPFRVWDAALEEGDDGI